MANYPIVLASNSYSAKFRSSKCRRAAYNERLAMLPHTSAFANVLLVPIRQSECIRLLNRIFYLGVGLPG